MALRRGQASLARHGVVTGGASMVDNMFRLAMFHVKNPGLEISSETLTSKSLKYRDTPVFLL